MALPSMGGITQLGEGLNKKVKKFELTLPPGPPFLRPLDPE